MSKYLIAALCASSIVATAQASAYSPQPANETVCKFVTTPERGTKPFQMCLTKAEWAAMEERAAQDANRIVCRYEDVPGSKLKGRKVCQPASQWAADKAMHREQVEIMQQKACVPGGGC